MAIYSNRITLNERGGNVTGFSTVWWRMLSGIRLSYWMYARPRAAAGWANGTEAG